MLVYGALELSGYAVIPPPDGFKRPIVGDALLEATLVHVRLLDDFLDGTTPGRKHDIKRATGVLPGARLDPSTRPSAAGSIASSALVVSESGWDMGVG